MVDSEWLKNLAGATIKDGHWTVDDPDGVRRLAEARVTAAIVALEDEAREASEIHNIHARGERSVRVLSLAGAGPGSGFTLLLGRAQVTLAYTPHALVATLSSMEGFRRSSRELCRLRPHADAFGSVAWRSDNALLMTNELIIKKLFEDLTRAALEAGNEGAKDR